jgi:ATP-dependent Clp protease ATP-binding subunit ClpC
VFERFTDRARRAVVLAQEEARMLNHDYIGTEHLLLGLMHEGQGVAAMALDELGISLQSVRETVEQMIGQGPRAPAAHIPFTPRAKKVLELSLREAQQLGHHSIGTEHVLLGLVREGEGVAAQALIRLGADLNGVRQRVVQLLAGPVEASADVTAEAVGQTTQGPRRTGAWRVERIAPTGSLRRAEGDPERAPTCPRCEADLTRSARYRIQDVRPGSGAGDTAVAHAEGTRRASILYCVECGRVIAANLLDPDDGGGD